MTIWILTFVLIGSCVGMGLRQGAIRAAFSLVGIIFAALLAAPLGKPFKLLLPHVGVHNLTVIWVLGPVIAFLIVLTLFKMAGHFVHQKADVYYKYKAGDLRLSLWTRLNSRVGACVGVLNGTVYLLLAAFYIFNFSYWTAQVAPSDSEARTTRLVNQLGLDLQNTGLSKAARSLVTLPENFYKSADIAGLLCQNPRLSDRLGRYPAFLSLAERDDVLPLTQDSTFTNDWNSRAPMSQLLDEAPVKTILENDELINTVWAITQTNLDDLLVYLKTGNSAKYDPEKILGRWDFNVNVSLALVRQARPNIPATEMRTIRAMWGHAYAETTFIASADNQAFLKNLPSFKAGQPPITWKGTWTANDTNYDLALSANGANKSMTALTGGARLTLKDNRTALVFDRE
jgi:hypothetical protein